MGKRRAGAATADRLSALVGTPWGKTAAGGLALMLLWGANHWSSPADVQRAVAAHEAGEDPHARAGYVTRAELRDEVERLRQAVEGLERVNRELLELRQEGERIRQRRQR